MKLVKNVSTGPTAMKFTILGRQAEYVVDICRSVGCSCSFFSRSSTSRKKVSCKHIIWVLINVLQVPEKSDLLQQLFLTDKELKNILTGVEEHHEPPTGSKNNTQSPTVRSPTPPSVVLTNVEMESIFEAKQSTQRQQIWRAGKSKERMKASCSSCKSTMPAGKIFVVVSGLYIPRGQRFAVDRQFYFCADLRCIGTKPLASNLTIPPKKIEIKDDLQLSADDISLLRSRGLPLVRS